jgi:hypothetical protein
MSEISSAWSEVGDRMSALCLKLKLHGEEELSDEAVKAKAGLDKLGAAVEGFVDAIGDAYDDPAVKSDAKDVARAFLDAINTTVRQARDRIA